VENKIRVSNTNFEAEEQLSRVMKISSSEDVAEILEVVNQLLLKGVNKSVIIKTLHLLDKVNY